MKRNLGILITLGGLIASIAYAAATGDRLKSPVQVGQGLAVTEKIQFDTGHGSANATVQSNSVGDLQLVGTGTPYLTVPTTGNVGIGDAATAPGSTLDVESSTVGVIQVSNMFGGTSGGSYSTWGYNLKPTTTTNQYSKASVDTASMIRFNNGGLQLYGDSTTTTGTLTAGSGNLNLIFSVDSSGNAATGGPTAGLTVNGSETLVGSLQIASGGAFKVKVFTGTLAPQGGNATLTAPSGVIYSLSGWGQNNVTSTYCSIVDISFITTSCQMRFYTGTSTSVVVQNDDSNGGHANSTYRVVMVYD